MRILVINSFDNTTIKAFTVHTDTYSHVSRQIVLPKIGETIISPSTGNKFLVLDIQYVPQNSFYDDSNWFEVTHATDVKIIVQILPGNEKLPNLDKTV